MDKKTLLYYYWNLLDSNKKKEVEEYLKDGKKKAEYEKLCDDLNFLFPPADSKEFEDKIIPLSSVREFYHKKRAEESKKRSVIILLSCAVMAIFTLLIVIKRAVPSYGEKALISFISGKIYVINKNGEAMRRIEAGVEIKEGEGIYTPSDSSCSISLGKSVLNIHENTHITIKSYSIEENKTELYTEIANGGLEFSSSEIATFESDYFKASFTNALIKVSPSINGEEVVLKKGVVSIIAKIKSINSKEGKSVRLPLIPQAFNASNSSFTISPVLIISEKEREMIESNSLSIEEVLRKAFLNE